MILKKIKFFVLIFEFYLFVNSIDTNTCELFKFNFHLNNVNIYLIKKNLIIRSKKS